MRGTRGFDELTSSARGGEAVHRLREPAQRRRPADAAGRDRGERRVVARHPPLAFRTRPSASSSLISSPITAGRGRASAAPATAGFASGSLHPIPETR